MKAKKLIDTPAGDFVLGLALAIVAIPAIIWISWILWAVAS